VQILITFILLFKQVLESFHAVFGDWESLFGYLGRHCRWRIVLSLGDVVVLGRSFLFIIILV
jgi:hypothetical protein